MKIGAVATLVASAVVASPAAHAGNVDPAFGYWLVESGNAIIEISACDDGRACGEIVWLSRPYDDRGRLKIDSRNPDPAQRSQPICGLQLIEGFTRDGVGEWDEGKIYNASDGEEYESLLRAQEDGTLKVRGYVGLPIFGASQVWTRVDGDRGGCPSEIRTAKYVM